MQPSEVIDLSTGPTEVILQIENQDVRISSSEIAAAGETYFLLTVVKPDGTNGQRVRLDADVMKDLESFFLTLHDDRYRIYLIRTENQSYRLVIDVVTRDGRMLDPTNAFTGVRDQEPPAVPEMDGEIDIDNEGFPFGDDPVVEPQGSTPPALPAITSANSVELPEVASAQLPPAEHELTTLQNQGGSASMVAATAAMAAATVIVDPKQDWAVRLERAFASADPRQWRRLRRRRPR